MFVLTLIPIVFSAFDSFGCFSISPAFVPLQNISIPGGQEILVESCAIECIRTINNYTLVLPSSCFCGNSTEGLLQVEPSECSSCLPEPCGSDNRVSVYTNDLTIPDMENPEEEGRAIDKNIGTDAGLDQRKMALYISSACVVIILCILGYIWYRRRRAFQQTPVVPRLESKSSQEQLIPGLEKTMNMIYTVIVPYRKQRSDELDLQYNDVVQVQQVRGDWAYSANLKTGERGLHPLICFLELSQGPVTIPSRK